MTVQIQKRYKRMFYRPAFCCHCGEKIIRDDWRLWTSRRFCALCETEHQGVDLLPKIIVGLGLFSLVFAIATVLKRPEPANSETSIASQQNKRNLKPAALYSASPVASPLSKVPPTVNFSSQPEAREQINEQPQREKRTSDETVYYCGAITKKGTPCTRRVKTKGFCWQHAKSGQIAPARF